MNESPGPALARLRSLSASTPVSSLGPRALRRGRRSARERGLRFRSHGWQIVQCGTAAALAWQVATEVLGHPRPFFAPVAAVVALGVSYGDRLRRSAEVVAGVALGIGIGDLFVQLVGTGVWQIAVVVVVAMSLAVLLDAGSLLVTQAGVQAVIVTTLLPNPDAGLGRWLDAVVGGAVALGIAAVVPRSPLVRPRRLVADVVSQVADLLEEASRSARDGDVQRATRALERARASQPAMDALVASAEEGLDVVRGSPFRRRHRGSLRDVASMVEPLDRAMRNVRVLLRRVTVAAWRHEPVPDSLVNLTADLAEATRQLSVQLADEHVDEDDLALLRQVAQTSGAIPVGVSLSSDVLLAQIRSMTVDLLQVAGMGYDEALTQVPPARPPRQPPAPGMEHSAEHHP